MNIVPSKSSCTISTLTSDLSAGATEEERPENTPTASDNGSLKHFLGSQFLYNN